MPQAANVTKYNAGGSGDSYIPDGYIKTVEKIWMDSYTMAFTVTKTTIDIAVLPENKKITGIDIIIETAITQSTGTISVGFSTDALVDTFLTAADISNTLSRTTISLPFGTSAGFGGGTAVLAATGRLGGFQKVTSGTQTTISILLNNWVASVGTIKTIVRYT